MERGGKKTKKNADELWLLQSSYLTLLTRITSGVSNTTMGIQTNIADKVQVVHD